MRNFINFKPAMSQSILDGRKTQTRRLIKPQPTETEDGWLWTSNKKLYRWLENQQAPIADYMPYRIGTQVYVRESYWLNLATDTVAYGEERPAVGGQWKFVSAMFSLKERSRLTIEITGVRVQRLCDISQDDAAAEGMIPNWAGDLTGWDPIEHGYLPLNWKRLHGEDDEGVWYSARKAFLTSWDYLNPEFPVAINPWIVAYTFKKVTNADAS